jgi:fucose permease
MYGWNASLLGGVWPKMSEDIGAGITLIGILTMINYISSGLSSFFTYKIRMKLGTSRSNVLGLTLAAISMLILANATSFVAIAIAIVFLGASGGIIDVNSNSYVVKAYDAKWVSFMHSCWGLASSIGPIFMSAAILYTPSYKNGFKMILALIILAIVILLLLKMKWTKQKQHLDKEIVDLHSVTEEEKNSEISMVDVIKQKGVKAMLVCFTLANGAGCAMMAWLATIVVSQKGITVVEGATAVTAFSFALMLGRIGIGITVEKVGIQKTIKILSLLIFIFILALFLPYKSVILIYVNAALIGFMAGPITPLLNSNLKELFDKKILGELISLGCVCSLLGVSAISILMTIASQIISINYIQIIPAIGFFVMFLVYSNIVKK